MASHTPAKDVQRKYTISHVAEDHSYASSFKHEVDIQQLNAQQSPDSESKPLVSSDQRPETVGNSVGESNGPSQTRHTGLSLKAEHDTGMSHDHRTCLRDGTCTENFGPKDPESLHTQLNKTFAIHSHVGMSKCTTCGKGPFMNVKVHFLHCLLKQENLQCSVCKRSFQNKQSHIDHKLILRSCDTCGQILTNSNSNNHHKCPNGSYSTGLFCSELMPVTACYTCKAFFISDRTLFKHVAEAHNTIVRLSVDVHDKVSTSPVSSSDHIRVSSHGLEMTTQLSSAVQTTAGSLSSVVPSNLAANKLVDDPLCRNTISQVASKKNTSDPQRIVKKWKKKKNAPSPCSPVNIPGSPSGTECARNQNTTQSDPTMPTLSILAIFKNVSGAVALMKRMNTCWRAKAPYRCRQCGAISGQPSLVIRHRYLHRGPRSYRCQCGRAFKRRLHLLRHRIQHAEAGSYICVGCGETFTGATLLAEHRSGRLRKGPSAGLSCKGRESRKCQVPFSCDCGRLFVRPSAYIWHQLKNSPLK